MAGLYKYLLCLQKQNLAGGEGGIRTHGRFDPTLDFESSTFDHSATSPNQALIIAFGQILKIPMLLLRGALTSPNHPDKLATLLE